MNYRKLRDLKVSPIGLGCMGFSHGYGQVPSREYSIDAIRKAHDFGCNFFDTAEIYGREMFYPGHNEEMVGEAIKPFRKDVVLATKLHIQEEALAKETLYEHINRHLTASLQKLKTDYVDLYYLHRVNELVPIEDVAEVMGKLIKEGKLRAWGLSQVGADTVVKAHKVTPVSAVQNIYSIVERDCEKDIFPFCLANNIGVVPFGPTASGFLSGKITTETKFEEGDDIRKYIPQLKKENIAANQPILVVLDKFAKEKNATKAQISLAWILHKYPNAVPIPGSKNLERILENLGAWNITLTDEEFKALESALNTCTVHGHRGHVETEQQNFGNHWRKKSDYQVL